VSLGLGRERIAVALLSSLPVQFSQRVRPCGALFAALVAVY